LAKATLGYLALNWTWVSGTPAFYAPNSQSQGNQTNFPSTTIPYIIESIGNIAYVPTKNLASSIYNLDLATRPFTNLTNNAGPGAVYGTAGVESSTTSPGNHSGHVWPIGGGTSLMMYAAEYGELWRLNLTSHKWAYQKGWNYAYADYGNSNPGQRTPFSML